MIQLPTKQEEQVGRSSMRLHSSRCWLLLRLVFIVLVVGSTVKAGALSPGNPAGAVQAARRGEAKTNASVKQASDTKRPPDICATGTSSLNDQSCQSSRSAAVEVPEPASLFMVGVGLISIGALVRRRR